MSCPSCPSRRAVLAGLASTVAMPALSQAASWSAVADAARSLPQLHAILVAQDGETVLAEAFRGPGLGAPANVKSVSKSIVSLLLGAAIDRGVIPTVQATLAQVAPRLVPEGADPPSPASPWRISSPCAQGSNAPRGGNYGEWVASSNWVVDALGRPLVAEPGGRMLYSTGSTHVLGVALAEASGESLLTLAREWLGEPLGIEIPAWTQDPQGYHLGGNEMALTPRAMLRIAN